MSGARKDATTAAGPISNGSTKAIHKKDKETRRREREQRESLVLWLHPLTTLEFALRESFYYAKIYSSKLLDHKLIVLAHMGVLLGSYVLINTSGPHQQVAQDIYSQLLWCLYWIGLGVLSSVGLGTGLHTFLLYLGPHIARVTLAAYECGSVDFPTPPYPDEIVCPSSPAPVAVTIFTIMSKVRLEAMCWGAGTALGELPPYFMARAARLSGLEPDEDDEDLQELEELQKKQLNHQDLTLIERGKLFVENLVQRVGFLGILACASIPNPLFDLAGITCGHFLVPFWTFFGATLIGKAVIKMHIQKLFVIIAFNETLISRALELLALLPVLGGRLQEPFRAFLDAQKQRLHQSAASSSDSETVAPSANWLASVFELFVFTMILYFVLSIVNSLAQSHHKRVHKKKAKFNRD